MQLTKQYDASPMGIKHTLLKGLAMAKKMGHSTNMHNVLMNISTCSNIIPKIWPLFEKHGMQLNGSLNESKESLKS